MMMMFLDIEGILRTMFFWILKALLFLVKGLYNIFMTISRINVFDGDRFEIISGIYKRVQAILVIVMVFYLIFQFVQYILQPEVASDKNKGVEGSIKRIVVVVLLMAFTPTIFNFSYELKNRILHSQIIEKIVMDNGSGLSGGDNDFSCSTPDSVTPGECTDGGKFAARLLGLFVTAEKPNAIICDRKTTAQERIYALQRELAGQTTWSHKWGCGLNVEVDDNGTFYVINFEWLVAVPATLFIVWMFVLYCVEAGRMVFQFAFLQLIAPIPIMSYLSSNKDNMFNKWTKQCVTTYIDVFLRLFIINFVLLLCSIIPNLPFGELSDNMFVKIFLILGLMLFAVKAPELIKELLPKGGGAAAGGFGVGKKSAAASTLLGASRGTARALARTAKGTAKGVKKGYRAIRKSAGLRAQGQGLGSQLKFAVGSRWYGGVNKAHDKLNSFKQRRAEAKQNLDDEIKKQAEEMKQAQKDGIRNTVKKKIAAQKAHEASLRNNQLSGELDNVQQEINKTEARRRVLSSKVTRTKEETKELNELNTSIVSLNSRKSELTSSIKNNNKIIDDFKKMGNEISSGANVAYNDAKTKVSDAKTEVDSAKKELEKAKKGKDSEAISKAENDLKEKTTKLEIAEKELKSAVKENEGLAIKNYTEAQEELKKAKSSGNPEEVEAATKKVKTAEKEFSEVVQSYLGPTSLDKVESAKELVKQREEELSNVGLGIGERVAASGVGNVARGIANVANIAKPVTDVVGGLVKDAVDVTYGNISGAYKGAQAGDVTKVAAENRKYIDELRRRDEFIAQGGDPSLINTISAKVSSFASDYLGVPKPIKNVELQISTLDRKIKENERSNNNMLGIINSTDKFKSNIKDLLDGAKINSDMSALLDEVVDKGTGEKIYLPSSGKAQDVLNYYKSKANKAKDDSRIANEAAKKAEQELSLDSALLDDFNNIKKKFGPETWNEDYFDKISKEIKSSTSLDDAKKNKLANVARLQRDAVVSAGNVSSTENQMNYVKKLVSDEVMIQTISHFANGGTVSGLANLEIDKDTYKNATDFLSQINTACNDRKTAEGVIAALRTLNASPAEIDLFSKSEVYWSDLRNLSKQAIKNISDALNQATSDNSAEINKLKQDKTAAENKEQQLKDLEKYLEGGNSSSGGK